MIDVLQSDMEEWITNFVSQYNEELGTVPCPYAKKAMLANHIEYKHASSTLDIMIEAEAIQDHGLPKPVVVVGIDKNNITPKDLYLVTKYINGRYFASRGIVALNDHPDDPEVIAGVTMNQGKWALLLIQERNELERARFHLRKCGYYDKWTEEQLADMKSY